MFWREKSFYYARQVFWLHNKNCSCSLNAFWISFNEPRSEQLTPSTYAKQTKITFLCRRLVCFLAFRTNFWVKLNIFTKCVHTKHSEQLFLLLNIFIQRLQPEIIKWNSREFPNICIILHLRYPLNIRFHETLKLFTINKNNLKQFSWCSRAEIK